MSVNTFWSSGPGTNSKSPKLNFKSYPALSFGIGIFGGRVNVLGLDWRDIYFWWGWCFQKSMLWKISKVETFIFYLLKIWYLTFVFLYLYFINFMQCCQVILVQNHHFYYQKSPQNRPQEFLKIATFLEKIPLKNPHILDNFLKKTKIWHFGESKKKINAFSDVVKDGKKWQFHPKSGIFFV